MFVTSQPSKYSPGECGVPRPAQSNHRLDVAARCWGFMDACHLTTEYVVVIAEVYADLEVPVLAEECRAGHPRTGTNLHPWYEAFDYALGVLTGGPCDDLKGRRLLAVYESLIRQPEYPWEEAVIRSVIERLSGS